MLRFGYWIISVLIITGAVYPQAVCDKRLGTLILKARVLEAKPTTSGPNSISVSLTIETTFTNHGKIPIIILMPGNLDKNGKSLFDWYSGISVYGKNKYGFYGMQTGIALPSTCLGCDNELGKLLDVATPPDNFTRVLKSTETLARNDKIEIMFPLKSSVGRYGWDEVEINKKKLTAKFTYAMSPVNLGSYKRGFLNKLQKRWHRKGLLYFCDSHSLITSDFFKIDLSDIKL